MIDMTLLTFLFFIEFYEVYPCGGPVTHSVTSQEELDDLLAGSTTPPLAQGDNIELSGSLNLNLSYTQAQAFFTNIAEITQKNPKDNNNTLNFNCETFDFQSVSNFKTGPSIEFNINNAN